MFTLRRAAAKALSTRITPVTFSFQARSITFLPQTVLTRSNRSTILPTLQKRFASGHHNQDPVQPETTSAAEFNASDVEPVEAAETPYREPRESRERPRYDRGSRGPPRERDNSRRSFNDQVTPAPPNSTLFIGNLFFDVTVDDLESEFSKFGTIKKTNMLKDQRGLSKGMAFIEFEEQADATSALEAMNEKMLEGRRMMIQYSKPRDMSQVKRAREDGKSYGPRNPPSRTLYIGNMSFDLSDQDLSKLFSGIKNVLDVRIAIDRRTGQPRGFAHADFHDVESAESAFAVLNGKEVAGRTLRCDYSAPQVRSQYGNDR